MVLGRVCVGEDCHNKKIQRKGILLIGFLQGHRGFEECVDNCGMGERNRRSIGDEEMEA